LNTEDQKREKNTSIDTFCENVEKFSPFVHVDAPVE
jgi:hypothetical protein